MTKSLAAPGTSSLLLPSDTPFGSAELAPASNTTTTTATTSAAGSAFLATAAATAAKEEKGKEEKEEKDNKYYSLVQQHIPDLVRLGPT